MSAQGTRGLSPRIHNVSSYLGAVAVFVGVGLLRMGAQPTMAWGVLCALWTFHFLRRAWESAFVHAYSRPAVPVTDTLIELVYYWGFAFWISSTASRPDYALPHAAWLGLGILVFCIGELGNMKAHRMLRALRPQGGMARALPRGFLFERVSCPHYFFEIVSWVGFAIASRALGSLAFLGLGSAILLTWALQRHRAYRAEFNGEGGRERYPPERRALIPFVV